MILGITPPTEGSVAVFGRQPGRAVQRRIGYLPEERGLYRRMTARDTIIYFAKLKGMWAGKARRRADELLDELGLGHVKDRKIEALSKGMAQKVQLITAIAHEPELVILDEPFSGLDPINQNELEAAIRRLADGGTTVLFSTHTMSHAERLCDRFVILVKGRKAFDGTLERSARRHPAHDQTRIAERPQLPAQRQRRDRRHRAGRRLDALGRRSCCPAPIRKPCSPPASSTA